MHGHSSKILCDNCNGAIGAERAAKYDRNPNHGWSDEHYCSRSCYNEATDALASL